MLPVLVNKQDLAQRRELVDEFAVIRIYAEAGKVIATHEHKGDFREP